GGEPLSFGNSLFPRLDLVRGQILVGITPRIEFFLPSHRFLRLLLFCRDSCPGRRDVRLVPKNGVRGIFFGYCPGPIPRRSLPRRRRRHGPTPTNPIASAKP